MAEREVIRESEEILREGHGHDHERVERIEEIREECGCQKPLVFKSILKPVHFTDASQHIEIKAGPPKFAHTRPTFLKKGHSTYVQPHFITKQHRPLIVTKTTTSVSHPKIKKFITEHIERHPGHNRVIDTKVDRHLGSRHHELVSEFGFRNHLTPIRDEEVKIVESFPREREEIKIFDGPRRHEKIEIREEPHRHEEIKFVDERRENLEFLDAPRHHENFEFLDEPRREVDVEVVKDFPRLEEVEVVKDIEFDGFRRHHNSGLDFPRRSHSEVEIVKEFPGSELDLDFNRHRHHHHHHGVEFEDLELLNRHRHSDCGCKRERIVKERREEFPIHEVIEEEKLVEKQRFL